MSDKYADAFAFLEHMGKTLEDDALAALEVRRMHYDPRESTLALRYAGIGRDIRKMAKLLHEAFRYELDSAGRGADLLGGSGNTATRPDRPPSSEAIAKEGANYSENIPEPAPECTCDFGVPAPYIDPNCPRHGRAKAEPAP